LDYFWLNLAESGLKLDEFGLKQAESGNLNSFVSFSRVLPLILAKSEYYK
jgi:hypothetical protein